MLVWEAGGPSVIEVERSVPVDEGHDCCEDDAGVVGIEAGSELEGVFVDSSAVGGCVRDVRGGEVEGNVFVSELPIASVAVEVAGVFLGVELGIGSFVSEVDLSAVVFWRGEDVSKAVGRAFGVLSSSIDNARDLLPVGPAARAVDNSDSSRIRPSIDIIYRSFKYVVGGQKSLSPGRNMAHAPPQGPRRLRCRKTFVFCTAQLAAVASAVTCNSKWPLIWVPAPESPQAR